MMEQYQFAYPCFASCVGCHFNRTMAETMFGFLIILRRILGIMYQQVYTLRKGQEIRIVLLLLPLDIGRIDETPTGILDTIEYRPIEGMAMGKFYCDA